MAAAHILNQRIGYLTVTSQLSSHNLACVEAAISLSAIGFRLASMSFNACPKNEDAKVSSTTRTRIARIVSLKMRISMKNVRCAPWISKNQILLENAVSTNARSSHLKKKLQSNSRSKQPKNHQWLRSLKILNKRRWQ